MHSGRLLCRQQLECLHVGRLHQRELAVVESRQFVLAETLYGRKDQAVDKTDICISVTVHQLVCSCIVGAFHLVQIKRATLKIVQECQRDSGMKTLGNPVVNLWKRSFRNNKALSSSSGSA